MPPSKMMQKTHQKRLDHLGSSCAKEKKDYLIISIIRSQRKDKNIQNQHLSIDSSKSMPLTLVQLVSKPEISII